MCSWPSPKTQSSEGLDIFAWILGPVNSQFLAYLLTLTQETLKGKLHLLCNAPPVICSEMKTASITNKQLQKEKGSYKLMFSLETVTFYYKKILQLLIWLYMWSFMSFKLGESLNNHSWIYKD